MLPSVFSASTTPAASPTPAAVPIAAAKLPAPALVSIVGVSIASICTEPLPPIPAVTVADTISAVVAVPRVTVDDAPEPAADTARPPFALATLMPTPKARASICCLDSAVSEMSPPAATLPVSIAARTVFVTSTSLLAAPTVTPTAALLLSTIPSPAPPALELTFEVSVAVTMMPASVVTFAEPVIVASVSIATVFVLPAPAPERPTAIPSDMATCPVPAIVHEVIVGLAVAVTVTSPVSTTVALSMVAVTAARSSCVPISLFATETPAATEIRLSVALAAMAPATALTVLESSALTVRLFAVTFAPLRTAAVLVLTTVLTANEPAPTNDMGGVSTPPVELRESAPLTPTAQAFIVLFSIASTLTSPPTLVTEEPSLISAVTSTPT